MPSRDDIVAQPVRQWMEKARADLLAAVSLAEHQNGLWDIVAFHCQQAPKR